MCSSIYFHLDTIQIHLSDKSLATSVSIAHLTSLFGFSVFLIVLQIGVLMQELNNTWGDMKSVPPDPFLVSSI